MRNQLALFLTLLTLACGGDLTEPTSSGCAIEDGPAEVIGEMELAEDGSLRVVSQDKFWTTVGGTQYRIPTNYGRSRLDDPNPNFALLECDQNISAWGANCVVAHDRVMSYYVDRSNCGSWGAAVEIAADDTAWIARNSFGWSVTKRTSSWPPAELTISCRDATPNTNKDSEGEYHGGSLVCYNMSSSPHDLCLETSPWKDIEVHYWKILPVGVTTTERTYKIRNVVRHEFGHALGLGHSWDGGNPAWEDHCGDPMESIQCPDALLGDLSFEPQQQQALRDFHYGGHTKCNWLPGDPLGNACPGAQ